MHAHKSAQYIVPTRKPPEVNNHVLSTDCIRLPYLQASPILSVANKLLCFYQGLLLRLFHPIIRIPNWMMQHILQQRRSPQCTRQRKVPLRCFLDIVNKLRCPKPPLFPFHFTILCCPPNFPTKLLKVTLGQSPLALLHRVAKLAPRKLLPQAFDGGQVGIGNVLDIREIHKITAFGFGAGDLNESITCELLQVPKVMGQTTTHLLLKYQSYLLDPPRRVVPWLA